MRSGATPGQLCLLPERTSAVAAGSGLAGSFGLWPVPTPSGTQAAAPICCSQNGILPEPGEAAQLPDISNNVGPVKSFFQFFSAVFVFSWAHYSVHSEEWSCWFSSPQLRRPRLVS